MDICKCEELTLHELCTLIETRRSGASRTSTVRAFIVTYLRTVAAGYGALQGGTVSMIIPGFTAKG